MRTLPSAVQTAINGQGIWPVRMISIQLGSNTFHISDHYRDLTYAGNTFLGNGTLLAIDNVVDSTTANHDSLEISLSAIDSSFRSTVIAENAIGGSVDVYRGLINPTTGALLADPLLIYEGIIFSTTLSEENPTQLTESLVLTGFSATVEVRSSTYRLDETPGRFTNDESQRKISATDNSMEFVAGLNGRNVRFGGAV